ncbi:MAG TPA: hypothetical protein VFG10_00790 [Saprospiraceae bacterium]|nr:hypothetical protein [Saprospiraceae bacterium]
MLPKFQLFILLSFLLFQGNVISQDNNQLINKLNRQLKNGETTVNKLLANDSLMYLHSLTPFREMIKSNAKPGKLTMTSGTEPGTKITVKGTVVNKSGAPYKNATIYAYQTSAKGWYADTAAHILINSGDINHARLFGYLKTDDEGKFIIETIRPQGYPKSSLAGHIHLQYWRGGNKTLHGPDELQFEDDPRMTNERRKQSLEEGNLIAKNSGTTAKPVYEFRIVVD